MKALVDTLGIKRLALHSVSVAVVGAGGVGRVIVAGLSDVGAKVTIYNRTVEKAKAAEAKTIDGLSMFVNQAAEQFKIFTDTKPNPELMRNTACDCLSHG